MNNKKIVRKAKFGDNIGNWAKGLGRFALGNIPLFGDNIVNAIPGLKDFEPENKFAKGLMNFNEKVLNPVKDQVATMAINSAAPGVGTALATANKGADTAQYQGQNNSSKPLGIINPRYAQTGGPTQANVKPVKGGNLHRLSSTGVYADGNSHKEGGIKINKDVEVEGGEGIHQIGKDVVVSSDSLQDPETGLTFAETMTKLESLKGKYEALLKQELEKNKNKTTSNVIVYKKKLKEIDDQIKATYSKQETVASQMGLRDKNGNPNQLSQDIVETPQKQAMAPTQLSKMGGRLRYYTGSKVKDKAKAEYNSRNLEGGFDEFQQTLNKAARQQEEEINNQIIKEENTDEFENLLPEVTVTANHKLLQNIAKNYNPQSGFSNTTSPFNAKFDTKLNTDVSGNPIVNNENTDKKQNQVVVKNENVAPIQANIKKEEQKNVRPTIDDNTQEYADEYIDVIRQRMGLQNQSPNFNKLQQRMKNIPSVAQFGDKFGNTGLSSLLNQQKGLLSTNKSPLTGNGITNTLGQYGNFPQTPKFPTLEKQQSKISPIDFNQFQGINPIPLSPLQSQGKMPLFPNAKPLPLKEFNQRGFGNDNVVLTSNIETQPQDTTRHNDDGGGIQYRDLPPAEKAKRIEKGMSEDIIQGAYKKKKWYEYLPEGDELPGTSGKITQQVIAPRIEQHNKERQRDYNEDREQERLKQELQNQANQANIVSPTGDVQGPQNQQQAASKQQPQYEVRDDVKAFQQWYNQNWRGDGTALDEDGKLGPKTKAQYEMYKDIWMNEFHGKPLYKFGGNLHKLKRFQEGGRTKVGKTIDDQDMYRDDNIGGMYVNNNKYGDYSNSSEVVNAAGQQLNYGISESHAKRDDLPVVGGNTNTSITNSVREQKTIPQPIPSKPIPISTPKPIIDNNNNTINANLNAFKLIPGIGDIGVKGYNNPGIKSNSEIPKNNVITSIDNTTSNTKLPLNSNILTGKPRSKFNSYGVGRQLQALPKYDFNYHHNDTEYNENEMKENLRILRRYGFNTDTLTKEQLISLSKAIKGKMQYGGLPYITNTQGINPYPQKKENGWDKAGRIISGITGSIMPLLGGTMSGGSAVGSGMSGAGNSEMFSNLFKGLGGMNTGIMKKGGKVNKYKTGGWIQSVTKSIKKRGTAGVCTGSNFGGPSCPPGSRRYNLAVTFRKMARNRKHQYGGKIYDQNGYLTSNKSNFTSKKIIRGKNGQTPITTNNMAFPISANGRLLYPNTGNYMFPGNQVIETPIKAQMGLGTGKPYDAFKLTPTGNAYNDIMNPPKSNNNLFPTLPLVSGSTKTTPSGGTETSGNTTNMLPYRIAEGVTAASPLITEGMFQLFSKNYKDMKKKYPTDERRGEGLAQFKSNIDNALPNAQKMINDNQLSTLSTALEAAKNSGENPMTIAANVLPATFKSANELYSSVIGNLQNQLGQYHQWTKAIEDAKANEDYQTYNQALQNRQQIETRLKDSISKSLENANTYLSTYGPEGTRNAQKMVMDMLKQMPSLQQNDWWKSLMNQYGLDESGNKIQTPKVGKYGGNINNIRIKK